MKYSTGFWMSFHELTAGYPWLTKRVARMLDPTVKVPGRNPFAYLLGAIVPYAGRLGGGFGMLILVYIIGLLAAIALPAYKDYTSRAHAAAAIAQSEFVRQKLGEYFEINHAVPANLDEIGVAESNISPEVQTLQLDSNNMVLTVGSKVGPIVFIPSETEDKKVIWKCRPGEGTKPQTLPADCR